MRLSGKRIVILVEEGYEDLEFWVPWMRLQEEGAETLVASDLADKTYRSKSGGLVATTDAAAGGLSAANFQGLVIPGGWAPDKLRRHESVKRLVRDFHEQNKVIGLICHAGSVAISAGIVRGRPATGSLGIKDDLESAGATWVDKPAFRDGNMVWGRVVADIPAFCRELIDALVDQPK